MALEPTGYEFKVYFFNNAKKIKVYDKTGAEVDGVPLDAKDNTLDKVYKLDTLQVAHISGHSPCCVVWNGEKYCWC